ncbi:hypothetical protein AAE02nite_51390 [Adhaeribacter aerolatus]|uniref:Uncharacterized protein n=1 Tax=Adhaeribacter aerolatus TaxID=670289 RepID=A0A512B687_9BACT|nr:hypothetical protein [Adhaeribacter aerolatus]GEO07475.1 hypothetical protein AAE02nite_51390 [Adhaeribacter aerolatus]
MMVLDKVDEANLNKLSKFDCKEYLTYLRQSLGQEKQKAVVNDMRRTIHMIEVRLRKLNENR